jgi:hypothetical protein
MVFEYAPVVLIVTIFLVMILLWLIRAAAHLTDKVWQRYTVGFYGSFVVLYILAVAAAAFRLGYGIIRY